jgi:hypothetical protein
MRGQDHEVETTLARCVAAVQGERTQKTLERLNGVQYYYNSQVLGTVRHGVGHEDAAGILTSAGTPLWFIRGCSLQHTSFGGREDPKTTRTKTPQERNKNVRAVQCERTRSSTFLSSARNCPTWRWPLGRGWCIDQRGYTPLVYEGV